MSNQKLHPAVVALISAALLQACGGGGGSGPATPPVTTPPTPEARLQVQAESLSSETERSDRQALVERSATLSVMGFSATTRPHFKVQADGEALETAMPVQWDGQSGQAKASIKLRSDLAPGLYSGQWSLSACHDVECLRHLAGSPQTLTYQHRILPGFELSDTDVEFAGSLNDTPAPTAVTISLPAQAGGWSYKIMNSPETSAWLRHRAVGTQLELQPVQGLEGGVYKAELQVSATGVDRPPRTLSVKAVIDPVVKVLYSPSFTVQSLSTAAASSMRVLATAQAPKDLSWTAHSSTPWLRLTCTGSDASDRLFWELVPEAFEKLANGETHAASVEFQFSHGLPARTVNFRLIKRLAQLDSVDDTGLQAGRPGTLTLQGTGFLALKPHLAQLLTIDGVTPTAFQVLDNGRLKIDLPALAAGRYQLRLGTISGLPGQRLAFTVP